MTVELSGVAEFVAVVEEGGFSAAARRLGVSKSLVSDRVRQLEARIATRLLHRTTRSVITTEAGRAFYEHCREGLDAIRLAETEVRALTEEPQGCVRVSCTADFAADHIVPLLPDLRARHPRLDVELRVTDSYVDLMAEGLDVAIRYGPLAQESMVMRRLGSQRGVIVAAPSYIERRGYPREPEDLLDHDCLIFTPFPWGEEWRFVNDEGEHRRVRVRASIHTNSGLVQRQATIAGAGISLLANVLAGSAVLDGSLVRVMDGWRIDFMDEPERAIFAVYPDNKYVPPKVKALVEAIASHFGDPPFWDSVD